MVEGWKEPEFYSWGHITGGNNTTRANAERILKAVWQDVHSGGFSLLCHNAKFDLDVAYAAFGLAMPPWHLIQDTMVLAYLVDPHARELGLKPLAEKRLDMPPEERDTVAEWIMSHKAMLERDYPEILQVGVGPKEAAAGVLGGIKPSTVGAFIGYAPGVVVEPYANGDVIRTRRLFDPLWDAVSEHNMLPAYDRERKCIPIFLSFEREGIKVDGDKLEQDDKVYHEAMNTAEEWMRKALKAPSLDFNKDHEVGQTLYARNAVTEWTYTKTGKLSVAKDNLRLDHFRDRKLASVFSYRRKCDTILTTFNRSWRFYGSSGRMYTNWHLTRGNDAGNGTRTGRPSSSSPNFLNMPKKVEENSLSQYIYPEFLKVPDLPRVRDYILPDEPSHYLGRRDFNQQELRILAHFEDGLLLAQYLQNPRLDVHEFLRSRIVEDHGLDIDRRTAKELNFGYIYGQGIPSLAEKVGRPVSDMQAFRNAQMLAIPGMKKLSDDIKARTRAGDPIRTWGGREYYKEEAWIKGFLRDFGYKLINYLCQGSAADVTKESIIRYYEVKKEGHFRLTVYDENNISVPKKALKSEMLLLRDAMMSIEVDVPLMSDAEYGERLGSLQPLVEPLPDLSRWGITNYH